MSSSAAGFSFCVLLLSAAVGTSQVSNNSSTIAPDPEQLAGRIRALVRALQDADHLLRVLQDYKKNDPGVLNTMKVDANHTMIERLKSIMGKDLTTKMTTTSKTPPKKMANHPQQSYKVVIKDLTNTTRTNTTCRAKPCRARTKLRMIEPGARTKPRNAKRADQSTTTKKVTAFLHTTAKTSNGLETPIITNIYPMFGPGANERRDPVEFVPKDNGVVNTPSKFLLPPLPPGKETPGVFLGESPWIPIVSPFEQNSADKDLYEVAAFLNVGAAVPKNHKTLSFDTKEWKYTNIKEEGEPAREQDTHLQLLHHIQQIKRMPPHELPKSVADTVYFNEIGKEYRVEHSNDDLLSGSIPGVPGRDYPAFSTVPSPPLQCRNRRGYFGDPRSRCQAFYICQGDGRAEAMLCPNGTIFNQEVLVCDWWFNVQCPNDFNRVKLRRKR